MLRRLRNQGLTLVEITIAVGIIVILTALSVHGVLRARVNSNDGAASGNIKNIATAMENYRLNNDSYPAAFTTLINSSPSYLSSAYSDDAHQGYDYWVYSDGSEGYYLYAQPECYGITGTKFLVYSNLGMKRFGDYSDAGNLMLAKVGTVPEAPPGWNGDTVGSCENGYCTPSGVCQDPMGNCGGGEDPGDTGGELPTGSDLLGDDLGDDLNGSTWPFDGK